MTISSCFSPRSPCFIAAAATGSSNATALNRFLRNFLLYRKARTPVVVTFPLAPSSLPWDEVRGGLQQAGFHRLLVQQDIRDLVEIGIAPPSDAALEVVADRVGLPPRQQEKNLGFFGASLSLRQGTVESFSCRKRIGGGNPSAIISIVRTVTSLIVIRWLISSRLTARWELAICAVGLAGSSTSIWI